MYVYELVQPLVHLRRVGEWKVAFSASNHFADFGKRNKGGLAHLLLSFFDYWTWKHDYQQDVASIRIGGRLSKHQKGWTLRVGTERHLICIEVRVEVEMVSPVRQPVRTGPVSARPRPGAQR